MNPLRFSVCLLTTLYVKLAEGESPLDPANCPLRENMHPQYIWAMDYRATFKDDMYWLQAGIPDLMDQVHVLDPLALTNGILVFRNRTDPFEDGTIIKWSQELGAPKDMREIFPDVIQLYDSFDYIENPMKFGQSPDIFPAVKLGDKEYGSAALDIIVHMLTKYQWREDVSQGPFLVVILTDNVPRVKGYTHHDHWDKGETLWDDLLSTKSSYVDLEGARQAIAQVDTDKLHNTFVVVITQVDQDLGDNDPTWRYILDAVGIPRWSTSYMGIQATNLIQDAIAKATKEAVCAVVNNETTTSTEATYISTSTAWTDSTVISTTSEVAPTSTDDASSTTEWLYPTTEDSNSRTGADGSTSEAGATTQKKLWTQQEGLGSGSRSILAGASAGLVAAVASSLWYWSIRVREVTQSGDEEPGEFLDDFFVPSSASESSVERATYVRIE